jgi:hypothetical protein
MAELRVAELSYSKDYNRIELVVPHGTKSAQLGKMLEVLSREALARLPRGCPQCTSGDHLLIREQLENVIRVDLDKGTVLGP